MFKIGQTVEWTSQSQGSTKTKKGTIIDVVEAGRDAISPLTEKGISRTRIKFDTRISTKTRYVVEVERGGKSSQTDFYCPQVGLLKEAK